MKVTLRFDTQAEAIAEQDAINNGATWTGFPGVTYTTTYGLFLDPEPDGSNNPAEATREWMSLLSCWHVNVEKVYFINKETGDYDQGSENNDDSPPPGP